MKSKTDNFEVLVPSLRQHGCIDRISVRIPLDWDEARNTWVLTEEAHRIIEWTRARFRTADKAAAAVLAS